MLKSVRRLFNKTGFDITRIKTFHNDVGQHLVRVLDVHRIDAAIDVGANSGQYGAMLRRSGFTGHIYSFEPVKAVFDQLVAAARGDAKWHCFNVALGDEPGSKQINVYDSHVFSSFLPANDYSKGIWTSLNGVRSQSVEVARLADIFDTLPHRAECRRFLLKMDTQGFDLQVFRGARDMLGHVHVLASEVGLIAIYDGVPDPFATLAEYTGAGFAISGMYPINRDVSQAIIEYDCVMVRRDPPAGSDESVQR